MKPIECQQCQGTGKIFFRPNVKRISHTVCDMCQGSGEYVGNQLWMLQGKKIKEWRLKMDVILREMGRQFQIDASNLSKMERGIIKPDSELVRILN